MGFDNSSAKYFKLSQINKQDYEFNSSYVKCEDMPYHMANNKGFMYIARLRQEKVKKNENYSSTYTSKTAVVTCVFTGSKGMERENLKSEIVDLKYVPWGTESNTRIIDLALLQIAGVTVDHNVEQVEMEGQKNYDCNYISKMSSSTETVTEAILKSYHIYKSVSGNTCVKLVYEDKEEVKK